MTTDGLVDFAGANSFAAEDNIHAVLTSEPDPALACLELVLLANRGGGGDNIGVGIIQFF
jgi:serine/threonine protein phosphatase PrpC